MKYELKLSLFQDTFMEMSLRIQMLHKDGDKMEKGLVRQKKKEEKHLSFTIFTPERSF